MVSLGLLLACALAAEPSGDALPDAAPPEPASDTPSAFMVWQGFEHSWNRRVFGSFVVPHRVSSFATHLDDIEHVEDAEGVRSSGVVRFAQNTGVDGDWMEPRGFATQVVARGIGVLRDARTYRFVDQVSADRSPRAFRRFHDMIVVDGATDDADAVALLEGMKIRSACMDGEEACNSDGLWPYRFLIELGPCSRVSGVLACPVVAEIGRAWTPNHGGLKLIEEKALSQRMSIEITVPFVVLSGTGDALSVERHVFENALGSNHAQITEAQQIPVPLAGAGRFPSATVGLTGLGFEFFPTGRRRDLAHRGRYVGGWGLEVGADAYDPESGLLTLSHAGGIYLPHTVRRTGVSLEVGMALLQFGDPDSRTTRLPDVEGNICSNSHPKAPFFSRWTRCDRFGSGASKTDIAVGFEIGP